MTSVQKAIFLAVALTVSLVANALLFVDLNNRQNDLEAMERLHEQQTGLAAQQQLQLAQKAQQVSEWQDNYRQLSSIVEELRNELNGIVLQQSATANTASLADQRLENARRQIAELDSSLARSNQQREQLELNLSSANATIANLQRALRNAQSNSDEPVDNSNLLTRLNMSIRELQAIGQIGITETQQGEVRLSIPNEWLFNLGTVEITENSRQFARRLVADLSHEPNVLVEIVGHSDERLIVSALAERYANNWELSAVRAGKIANLMVEMGWDARKLSAIGKAATQPVREGSGSEAWQINRRVDIVIRKSPTASGS